MKKVGIKYYYLHQRNNVSSEYPLMQHLLPPWIIIILQKPQGIKIFIQTRMYLTRINKTNQPTKKTPVGDLIFSHNFSPLLGECTQSFWHCARTPVYLPLLSLIDCFAFQNYNTTVFSSHPQNTVLDCKIEFHTRSVHGILSGFMV